MRAHNTYESAQAARPNGPRLRVELAVSAAVGVALSVVSAMIAAANVAPEWAPLAAAARASMVALPVAVGVYAWYSRPGERFGPLLVVLGFASFLMTLAESGSSLPYSIGRVSYWVVLASLIWLFLAFPSGRLHSRVDRVLVWSVAGVVLLLFMPTALLVEAYPVPHPATSCVTHCPTNAFLVLDSEPPWIDSLLVPLRELLTVVLFAAVALRLVQRLRRASSLMRRTLEPVQLVAIAFLTVVVVGLVARAATPDSPAVEGMAWAIALVVPAMAVSFFVGLFQRRLYMADAFQALGHRVRGNMSHDELRTALRGALEDPSLDLVYWVDGGADHWVDGEGHPAEPPESGSGRCLSEARDGDRLVAGIVHDAALEDQHEFVEAVASFALIALENQRLTAKVEASLRAVRASRARILASADRERRRIERDLHDGAQQRLVALRIKLELAEEQLDRDPELARLKLHRLGEEVGATLEEIRALAGGVYPPLLADRGLAEALRAAALRLPLGATVEPDGVGRYRQEIESAVYFCCLEAMQNAAKHAQGARSVRIVLGQDDALTFEVRDDGAGFDRRSAARGSGLTNMHDRLAAVGGELDVRSSPGQGTVVVGSVPVRR